jgi:hypothetical protein
MDTKLTVSRPRDQARNLSNAYGRDFILRVGVCFHHRADQRGRLAGQRPIGLWFEPIGSRPRERR